MLIELMFLAFINIYFTWLYLWMPFIEYLHVFLLAISYEVQICYLNCPMWFSRSEIVHLKWNTTWHLKYWFCRLLTTLKLFLITRRRILFWEYLHVAKLDIEMYRRFYHTFFWILLSSKIMNINYFRISRNDCSQYSLFLCGITQCFGICVST